MKIKSQPECCHIMATLLYDIHCSFLSNECCSSFLYGIYYSLGYDLRKLMSDRLAPDQKNFKIINYQAKMNCTFDGRVIITILCYLLDKGTKMCFENIGKQSGKIKEIWEKHDS